MTGPTRPHVLAAAVGAAVLGAVVLGGCASTPMTSQSSARSTSDPAASVGGPAGTLEIKNFAFSPTPLAVKAGQTIALHNTDGTAHTVTADDKSFDTGNVNGGASATFTAPGKAGTYAFHCNIHDFMTGAIQVSGS